MKLNTWKITIIYLVLGLLWIAFSGKAAGILAGGDPDLLARIEHYKGWFYIVATAVLLAFMIRMYRRQILQAEQTIRKGNERFAMMFTLSPEPVLLDSAAGDRVLNVNEAFLRELGYERHELLARSFRSIDCWMDAKERDQFIHEIQIRGVSHNRAVAFRHRDGHAVAMQVSGVAITVDEESCILSICRSRVEAAEPAGAEESLHRCYQELFEEAPVSYLMIDATDRIVLANGWAGNLFGENPKNLTGTEFLEWFPDTPFGMEKARRVLARFHAGENVDDEQMQMRRFDGSEIWANLTLRPVCNTFPAQNVAGVVLEDISDRIRLEDALLEKQNSLKTAVKAAGLYLFDWNLESSIIEFTPDWKFGADAEESIGPKPVEEWKNLLQPEDRAILERSIQDYLDQPVGGFQVEFRMERPDGTLGRYLVQGSLHEIPDPRERHLIGAIVNLTEYGKSDSANQSVG